MRSARSRSIFVLTIGVMVASLAVGGPAIAKGPGGGGGGGGHHGTGGTTGGSGSLTLVIESSSSTDGLPHWGDTVRFDVTTTATTEPHVSLKCYQGDNLVYTTQTGYYASYPWPWTQDMTLSSGAWTGGAAACTATLYYFSGTNTVTLSTLSVPVSA
jgi:hypothetical protein